jgi:class 3 adenylate cyclase
VRAWTIHVFVYAAVSALLVFVWLLTTGSMDALQAVASDPTTALDEGFWPVWVLAFGATAVVIHTGVALSNGVFGFQAQRRRRRRRQELHRVVSQTTKWAGELATTKLEERRQRTPRPSAGQRQWVAVMFSDIADSTPLTESLGDEAWHRVLADHRHLVRSCVDAHDGTEVSTKGDSFFVRFDAVAPAVRCAMAIQQALADEQRDGDVVPDVRIGIHVGEAIHDDGGDLLGHVVNVASRVADAAVGGEILVTEPVADLSPNDVAFVDRGLETLKGVSQPRHLLEVKWAD